MNTRSAGIEGAPSSSSRATPAGSALEFSDYAPSPDAPRGYRFGFSGAVADDGAGWSLATEAFAVEAETPPVAATGARIEARIEPGDGRDLMDGVLRAKDVLVGDLSVGAVAGRVLGARLAPDETPAGLR